MSTKIKNTIIRLTLIIIGLCLITYYVWLRFIRERLPRDIPFDLSLWGFIVLLYICFIYTYVIKNLLLETRVNSKTISKLVSYIYIPLTTLDESIKTNRFIKPYYEKLLISLINTLKRLVTGYGSYDAHGYCYYYIYVALEIFPRVILVSALCIDTFYFHQLNFLYKVILVGLILVIGKYIKYSFVYAQEQYILTLEYMVNKIITNYEDPADEYPGMFNSFLSVKDFLNVQVNRIEANEETYTYGAMYTDIYIEEYKKQNNIPLMKRLNTEQYQDMCKEFTRLMEIVIPLSVHIDEYSLPGVKEEYKKIKAVIFRLYLLCWLYILLLSIDALDSHVFSKIIINMWDWIIQEMPRIKEESIEPFTGIELEIESGKSKLGSILNRVE